MPHVEIVPLSGFRVRAEELLSVGMTLPGFAACCRAPNAAPLRRKRSAPRSPDW